MATSFLDGGDRVAAALAAHGVATLFTLCGGHVSPILVRARARGLRIIDTRDEATAVFAADATARLTGTPGVAVVTAGPGLTNTITAVKNAQLAQSPVVVIGGAAPTALQRRGALQDIDQRRLMEPHVKGAIRVRTVADLGPAVTRGFAMARSGVPGPVFVECPADLLYGESSVRAWYQDAGGAGRSVRARLLRWYLSRHADRLFARSGKPAIPAPREPKISRATRAIDRSVRALADAKRPLLVIGSQAVARPAAASALAQAVDRLSIPVYLSGMARGLLGRDSPLQMRHERRKALGEADCVILAGVACDFRLDYGRQIRGSTTIIAANRSRRDATLNRRPSILALGDAGTFIEELAGRLGSVRARSERWVSELRARDDTRERQIDEQARAAAEHVNPLALFRALDQSAADEAIFVADGGDFVATASYVVRPRSPLSWLDPGAFGTLGVGAGFAIGAALSRPAAEVWLLWGDGASGFGIAEFDTLVRHHIPVIAIVGNDASWTQIAREQVKMLGDDVGTVLARSAYDEVARSFGAEGIIVRHGHEIAASLERARACARAGSPVLVNVWLDHATFREGSISI